jgi:anti-anti-sigma regulatory factor
MEIFRREIVGEAVVITLEIQSLDAGNARGVAGHVKEAMRGGNRIVMDLGALRYFDVEGFAAILNWAGGGADKAEVRFCSGSGAVRALFELLRANTVVSLYESREDAMSSFQRPERKGAEVMVLHKDDQLLPERQIA